jgi:ATP-binding cassette subfamily B protein/subfamily B ATP-binding cassette protein MsbA
MANFFRIVRLALGRKYTFTLAILCSIGVAVLWGANLSLVKPIVELIFADRPPHAWVEAQVAEAQEKVGLTRAKLANVEQKLASALPAEEKDLEFQRQMLQERLKLEQQALAWARWIEPLVKKLLPNSIFGALAVIIGILVLMTLVKDVVLVGNLMLVERLTQLAMFDLRKQLVRKTLKMDMAHFGREHSSQIMHHLTSDLNCACQGVNVVCGRMILEPLKALACLIGAALICWKLLVLSLIVAPLAGYVLFRLTQSLKRANRRAMEEMSLLFTLLSETLTNIQAVKAFGMERHERRRFHLRGKSYIRKAMRIMFYNSIGRASTEFTGITIISVAFILGTYLVANPQTTILGITIIDEPLSLGSMLMFYALLMGIGDPSRKMSEVINTFQRGIAAADRVYAVLDKEPTIVDPPRPKVVSSAKPELRFDGVSFHYTPDQPVLRKIDLKIPFGQTVAIVGPNGCGKSTLLNLLPRFYDPVDGAVRLEGIDVRELRMRDLRGMIGLVAQQAMLFDDTVRSNIRYGSPRATDEEVTAAAEKAHAHRFILEKLEQGYDTKVGERGGRLSGGQRQRILLARAILRNPRFLILDEATSQIDLESEQLIHRVLEQFRRGRTTLLITHRISSIALADRVIVMDGGQILDDGTHEELMRRCDLYNRLYMSGMRQSA